MPNAEPVIEWTPGRGLRRAILLGGFWSIVAAALLAVIAWFAPALLFNALLRAFVAFGVAWLLFGIVQSAAGMVGGWCSFIAGTFSLAVMVSNHFVWAIHGAPIGDTGETLVGFAEWFNPAALLVLNLWSAIGIGACALICHNGQPGPGILHHVGTMPLRGRTREPPPV